MDVPSMNAATGTTPGMASLTLTAATPQKENLTLDSSSSPVHRSSSSSIFPTRLAGALCSPTLPVQEAKAIAIPCSQEERNSKKCSTSKRNKKKRRKSSQHRKKKKSPEPLECTGTV
eukprot:scaffold7968_cov130-Amphora_coffeaeformis.AAC.1